MGSQLRQKGSQRVQLVSKHTSRGRKQRTEYGLMPKLVLLLLLAGCAASETLTSPSSRQLLRNKKIPKAKPPSPKKNSSESESESDFGARIAGGVTAEKDRYPYMVSLKDPLTEAHFCGGVLIDKDTVLTAAHCVERSFNHFPKVSIGAIQRDADEDAEERTVCRTIIHQSYEDVFGGFDIALLFLNEASQKKPIDQLDSTNDDDRDGLLLSAIGWGKTGRGGFSDTLQVLDNLEYMSNRVCGIRIDEHTIQDTMLCARSRTGDLCDGDHGGPLIRERLIGGRREDVLIGLASFSRKDCGFNRGDPGVYTRIGRLVNWIRSKGKSTVIENVFINDRSPECSAAEPVLSVSAREIVRAIKDGNTKWAAQLVLSASRFGSVGEDVLDETTSLAVKQCLGVDLSAVFSDAVALSKKSKTRGDKSFAKLVEPLSAKLKKKTCDVPAPKAKDVVAKMKKGLGEIVEDDVTILLQLGKKGAKVLAEIRKLLLKNCVYVGAFAQILIDAALDLGEFLGNFDEEFDQWELAVAKCSEPPPEVESPESESAKPPAQSPPPAVPLASEAVEEIIEKLKSKDEDGALEIVIRLAEEGDEDTLMELVEEGAKQQVGFDLATLMTRAANENPELEDILNPVLDYILVQITIEGLADILLNEEIEVAASEVASMSSNNEFPALEVRIRIIVGATTRALEIAAAKPASLDSVKDRLSQIFVLAPEIAGADTDAIDPAIDILLRSFPASEP